MIIDEQRLAVGGDGPLLLVVLRAGIRGSPPGGCCGYLEEDDEATIDELVFAASCLAALGGNNYREAAQALRDITEKASRRRRGRAVG
jgi:hypothetical protein